VSEIKSIASVAGHVVRTLAGIGKSVTTAESCTGGWIAKALTDVPGSSACFAYGVVCYSNGAKESLLGVHNQTLVEHGAVSEAVVREMVQGAIGLSGADFGVAVSGIAGPDGGSEDKPVGTVCFAWASRALSGIRIDTARQQFTGDREHVRAQSVAHALQGIKERLGT
jgi:nicotinamide-nucleotide amidase